MKTYYKITLGEHFSGIKTVQVESETPCTITIDGDRKNRTSTYDCYYSNLETAKTELVQHFEKEIRQAEFNIKIAKKSITGFKKYLIELENYQT